MKKNKFIRISKGLDLPITGEIEEFDAISKSVNEVAIVGPDFVGMKPSIKVRVGDTVKAGQVLFSCKKNEGLQFCSRYNGKVEQINRGDKRAFESLVISLSSGSPTGGASFSSFKKTDANAWEREDICKLLVESGEWTSLRERPFDKVAAVGGQAESLFVTVTDSNPLALDPRKVVAEYREEFEYGLEVLSKLPEKKMFLCVEDSLGAKTPEECETYYFTGKHPAGNVGTHINMLQPINLERKCWHIGYQDVIAIGHLFMTGQLFTEKMISLAGPMVAKPKVIKTLRGARVSEVVSGELNNHADPIRVIAGSVFHGRKAENAFDFIGHFHNQITAIREDNHRELLGWKMPGFNKFSTKNVFAAHTMPWKKFNFGTSTHGSIRAMVPIGMFENIMPLDILPTQLLRALASGDLESAQDLGCLELSEEDVALCTFVAPGKVDFGPMLRNALNTIEKEG